MISIPLMTGDRDVAEWTGLCMIYSNSPGFVECEVEKFGLASLLRVLPRTTFLDIGSPDKIGMSNNKVA
jgi:hypothetical protein